MDFIYDPYLVLYLPLYRLDGAPFASRDAQGHLATVAGALWRPNGHTFDGADDQLGIPDRASLRPTTGITVETWLWPDTMPSGSPYFLIIAGKGIDGFQDYGLVYDRFGGYGGRGLIFMVNNAGSSIAKYINYEPDLTWHHVVGTYDSVQTRLFFDAVEKTPSDPYSTAINQSAEPVAIGGKSGVNRYYHGMIGEVRIYRRALTHLEVQHNYLATKWRYQ